MNRQQRRQGRPAATGQHRPPADATPLHRAATAHHAAGRLDEAAQGYRQALAIDPGHPDSLHLLGVIAYQTGRVGEAVPLMRDAVARGRERGLPGPALAAYLTNLGSALQQAGEAREAVAALRDSLALAPDAPGTHANLANALKDLGAYEEAAAAATQALRLRPDFANALNTLGGVEQARGRMDAAIAAFRRALELAPDSVMILANLGAAARAAGDTALAETCLTRALTLAPGHDGALGALACLRQDQGHVEEAESLFRRQLALRPGHALAHLNLGILLAGPLGSVHGAPTRLDEAAGHLEQAIALLTPGPGQTLAPGAIPALDPGAVSALAGAHGNLGVVRQRQGRHGEAVASLRQALDLTPDDATLHTNLGTALDLLGRPGEAARHYSRAAQLDPTQADARFNLALTALAGGDLALGWPLYESRWGTAQLAPHHAAPPCPPWDGGPLTGLHLLVWREQGLGDEILFSTLLPGLAERVRREGGRLSVAADHRLIPLLAPALPGVTLLPAPATGESEEAPDRHLPLGSLPALLRPDLGAFVGGPSSLFTPPPPAVAAWRTRLEAAGPALNIGLCWRSGLGGGHRQGAYTRLEDWRDLASQPGLRLISLQYDDATAEITAFNAVDGAAGGNPPRLRHPGEFGAPLDLRDDQAGVAALIAALDLVISAPTAVGELAAAVGTPCWRVEIAGGAMVDAGQAPRGGDWSRLGTGTRPWFPAQRIIFAPDGGEAARKVARALRALAGPDA